MYGRRPVKRKERLEEQNEEGGIANLGRHPPPNLSQSISFSSTESPLPGHKSTASTQALSHDSTVTLGSSLIHPPPFKSSRKHRAKPPTDKKPTTIQFFKPKDTSEPDDTDSHAKIILSICKLPNEIIAMITRILKAEGEHYLLASLASIPEAKGGVMGGYRGRLILDKASARLLTQSLPKVSKSVRNHIATGLGDDRSISVPKYRISSMTCDVWHLVPCISEDSETDEETLETPLLKRSRKGGGMQRTMIDLLSMVEALDITELPRARHCAILAAVARCRSEENRLLTSVSILCLGPGVFDHMADWRDRHDGRHHPVQHFHVVACRPRKVCVDFSRVITQELFIGLRFGLDRSQITPEEQQARAEYLRSCYSDFLEYGRDTFNLLENNVADGCTISIHRAELGMCTGYTLTRYRLFYSSGSLLQNEVIPLDARQCRAIATLYGRTVPWLGSLQDTKYDGNEIVVPLSNTDPADLDRLEKGREMLAGGVSGVYGHRQFSV